MRMLRLLERHIGHSKCGGLPVMSFVTIDLLYVSMVIICVVVIVARHLPTGCNIENGQKHDHADSIIEERLANDLTRACLRIPSTAMGSVGEIKAPNSRQ